MVKHNKNFKILIKETFKYNHYNIYLIIIFKKEKGGENRWQKNQGHQSNLQQQ